MSGGKMMSGFSQAKISRGALYILIATSSLSLVFLLAGDELKAEMARALAASGHSVWSELRLWQLVTSPLLEPRFIGLLFQAFMLWMFLPTLERWWGMKRFLYFALYTSLAGSLAGTLVSAAISAHPSIAFVSGLDPFIFGGIVAYGVLFANQRVQFFGVLPMTGRQLTIGISIFMLAFVFIGQQWPQGAANVGAMVLAYFMASGKWTPKLWWLKRKQKRIRSKLRVVRDGDDPKKWIN